MSEAIASERARDTSTGPSSKPILELRDVSKAFSGLTIIDQVSLQIREGARHAIIGPNGAGKSTLFNLTSGLYRIDSGSIHLFGERVDHLPIHQIVRRGLSRSFQITNVYPGLTVFENLRLGVLGRFGIRFRLFQLVDRLGEITEETERLMESLRLQARSAVPAAELPYSEQRALEIGMTLASGAKVILLDEPTSGMSTDESRYVVELLREVTVGRTLVTVEHDMDVVFDLCDQISVLVYGRILATGTPDEIRNSREVQKAYLGEGAV